MDDPQAFVDDYLRAFDQAVRDGSWEHVTERFEPDGVLEFVGVPAGPFRGRSSILAAYVDAPPDDTIRVDGAVAGSNGVWAVPFAWASSGERGEMEFTLGSEGIVLLRVRFL